MKILIRFIKAWRSLFFKKVPGIRESCCLRGILQKGEAGGRFYGRKEFVILRVGADEYCERGPVSLNLTFNFLLVC